jgi:hypothetical protein
MRQSHFYRLTCAGLVGLMVSSCGAAGLVIQQSDRRLNRGATGEVIYRLAKTEANERECLIIAAVLRHKPLGLSLNHLRTRVNRGEAPMVTVQFPSLNDQDQLDLEAGNLKKQMQPYDMDCGWKALGFKGHPAMSPGLSYSFIGAPMISASGNLAVIGVGHVGPQNPRALGLDPTPNPVVGEGQICLLRRSAKGWAVETCRTTWAL